MWKTYSVRAQKQNTPKRRKIKIASSNGKSYLPHIEKKFVK
jgi:hypothetical protein